ncbi:hypothetical protein DENSPDRAFT_855485 [Dentipellis sp. KUC8613]|nr:hypothetical protein DENSPDRAFT_855485 [Dentipellis sp. KUC8613]
MNQNLPLAGPLLTSIRFRIYVEGLKRRRRTVKSAAVAADQPQAVAPEPSTIPSQPEVSTTRETSSLIHNAGGSQEKVAPTAMAADKAMLNTPSPAEVQKLVTARKRAGRGGDGGPSTSCPEKCARTVRDGTFVVVIFGAAPGIYYHPSPEFNENLTQRDAALYEYFEAIDDAVAWFKNNVDMAVFQV